MCMYTFAQLYSHIRREREIERERERERERENEKTQLSNLDIYFVFPNFFLKVILHSS